MAFLINRAADKYKVELLEKAEPEMHHLKGGILSHKQE